MKNLEKTIEKLQKQLDEVKQQLNKPTFEVGKWYKDINSECIFNYVSDNNSYGIQHGNWISRNWTVAGDSVNWETRPATDKEVEEALIKEAIKRGFKEGVEVNKTGLSPYTDNIRIESDNFKYNPLDNALCLDDHFIFKDGKWAEIIKDEPIKIGGYEVKKVDSNYKIGCKLFTRESISNLAALMYEQKFKTVSFDGNEVTLETIEKILSL